MSSQYVIERNDEKLVKKIKSLLKKDDKNVKIEEFVGKYRNSVGNVYPDENLKILRITSGDEKQKFSVRCVESNVYNLTDEKGEPTALKLSKEELLKKMKKPSFKRSNCIIIEENITRDDLKGFKKTLKDKKIDLEFEEDSLLGKE